jgi:hypothetical protein
VAAHDHGLFPNHANWMLRTHRRLRPSLAHRRRRRGPPRLRRRPSPLTAAGDGGEGWTGLGVLHPPPRRGCGAPPVGEGVRQKRLALGKRATWRREADEVCHVAVDVHRNRGCYTLPVVRSRTEGSSRQPQLPQRER